MITFVRQTDGTYKKSGELSSRRAQIQIDDQKPYSTYTTSEAINIIENAIAKGQVRAERYTVIPAKDTEPMPAAVKEKFRVVTAEKKADRPGIQCSYDGCTNEYPRAKGRYPQRFCPKHREKK